MRVNNQESQDPASGSAPVKLFWAGEQEPHILVVGKRDGRVEKWDVRAPAGKWRIYFSILLISYFIWIGASDDSDLLPSYPITPLASPTTNILISTLFKHKYPAAVAGVSLSKETIQDLEKGKGANDGCLLVATNDRVLNMRLADLSTVRTYEMPKGMSFKEEGGASMHPSGQRVRLILAHFLYIHYSSPLN